MSKIRILISDNVNLKYVDILDKSKFYVDVNLSLSNNDLIKYSHVNPNSILFIKSRRIIDKAFLSRCNFDVIATASKGVDHIDVEYAVKRNIKIINSESGNSLSAAEHTWALILGAFKKILTGDYHVRNQMFDNWHYERNTLNGKKIGIIGTGKVGLIVAKFANSFGMKVLANDISSDVKRNNKHLKYYSLDYVLRNSDIITIHIPLDKRNKNFFDKKTLDKMKNNVIFINTSRGDVVDEDYLIEKVNSEKNFFIALDVFKNEPFVNEKFKKISNGLFTNHVAGKALEGEQDIGKELFLQVKNMY